MSLINGKGFTLDYSGPGEYFDSVGVRSPGSSCIDLVYTGKTLKFPRCFGFSTGISIVSCKPGLVGLLFLRSSAAAKTGLRLANGVGVIDSDYRDEIVVLCDSDRFCPVVGSRFAQLMFVQYAPFLATSSAVRSGGIGSTGE